jgi:hypothetical protein
MLGFIKNLTKKSDNSFYLELKDDQEVKPSEPKKKEPQAVVTEKASQAVVAASSVATTVAEKAPKAAVSAADAAAAALKASKKEAAEAAKSAKIEAAKSAKAQKEADAAEKAALAAKKKELPVETNFSTKYLLTQSSAERRRPGANMNGFLEMAKGLKPPARNNPK